VREGVNKKLRILVSVVLLGWLAWRTDWQQIRQAATDFRLSPWLAALGLYLAIQTISGLRWQLLARPLGFQGSVWQFTRLYFIGMFFNLFLPTSVGGDVIRAWHLGGRSEISAFLSVLVDRLSGLAVLLALAWVAVVLCPIPLPGWIIASVWCAAGAGLAGVVLAPGLLAGASRFGKVGSLAERSLIYLRQPLLLMETTALSLLIQAGNVVLVWLVGQAVQAPVPAYYYWIMVPMVTLLTLAPVSLNGMGVREGATILFLTPLGVSQATALSLAILWFAVFTAASLIGGVFYLAHRPAKPEVHPQTEPEYRMAA
jgi:uncharacterized membrane protein YbhN (UPF0104 family)